VSDLDKLRDLGSQVRDQATERYNQLRDQAQNYYQQGRDRATEWEQSLESYVQEKPIQAVLMAAGVGVLLGLLFVAAGAGRLYLLHRH
jgi:ElaB/YqjD/DUF883 family membrane-anchored ribosome-binding protein